MYSLMDDIPVVPNILEHFVHRLLQNWATEQSVTSHTSTNFLDYIAHQTETRSSLKIAEISFDVISKDVCKFFDQNTFGMCF